MVCRVGTRGAGLSKDIALSVKNKLTHLGANVSDDLARLSGKVEDAFAYADGAVSKNIGSTMLVSISQMVATGMKWRLESWWFRCRT
ncbi:MAG: hypothetical protein ACLTZN_04410 [Streptococcus sp.]